MKLVLVRGLPGSGKSTHAKSLGIAHFEADMYHLQNGVYKFEPTRVKESHLWCQGRAYATLQKGQSVVISNTFTQIWEMEPYFEIARIFKATLEVIEMKGNFGNIHAVPIETIAKMRARWEDYKTAKERLNNEI